MPGTLYSTGGAAAYQFEDPYKIGKGGSSLYQFEAAEESQNILETPTGTKRYSPIVVMLMGRRNAGKTFTMTCLADVDFRRFLRWNYPGRIFSNYALMLPGTSKLSNDDKQRPRVQPIQSAKIVEQMNGYVPWAHDGKLCVDEAQQYFSSRRSMSQMNVGFSAFLTQIRKVAIDTMFTTQHPQVVDYQVLLQVDLFVEVHTSANMHVIDVYLHDWWGQWTGRNYRRPWPPQRIDADDMKHLVLNPERVFKMYDTDQRIPPYYLGAAVREALQESEEERLGYWQNMAPAMDEAMSTFDAMDGVPQRPAGTLQRFEDVLHQDGETALVGSDGQPFGDLMTEQELLHRLPVGKEFAIAPYMGMAHEAGVWDDGEKGTLASWGAWLEAQGFRISKDKRNRLYAIRDRA